MENRLSHDGAGESARKKRGRPPGSRKGAPHPQQASKTNGNTGVDAGGAKRAGQEDLLMLSSWNQTEENNSEEQILTLFSSVLRQILHRDRAEITRVARELDVADNTVYRWMNGSSEPRIAHLRRLPEVLPEHRSQLIYIINQTFGGLLDSPVPGLREVHKEVYQRVLELIASCDEQETRFWLVSQAIFDYALLHLDTEHRGLAITFAKLLPPHEDGIHSLREVAMRGTHPWPYAIESKGYLGSTTLAGTAIALQRLQIWNEADINSRTPVEIDEFEHSACAVPVMRGNLMAGVFIVSSTQPDFFSNPLACQAVSTYALLMGIALSDADFYPFSRIHLRPMPDLAWQRAQMTQTYVDRVLTYARQNRTSRSEAELYVQGEWEKEFEKIAWTRRQKIEQQADALTQHASTAPGITGIPSE